MCERGNKANLDGETNNRFNSSHDGDWVVQPDAAWEEAAPVKRGDAEDE